MEGNSNMRTRASEENPSKMEGELRSMRREIDELSRIQSADSPFTTEVLNQPLPLRSVAELSYKTQEYMKVGDAIVTK